MTNEEPVVWYHAGRHQVSVLGRPPVNYDPDFVTDRRGWELVPLSELPDDLRETINDE